VAKILEMVQPTLPPAAELFAPQTADGTSAAGDMVTTAGKPHMKQ
jgi:hypothetical protein